MQSLTGSGIDLTHVQRRRNCANQSAYIIIDQSTGERTVFWSRPECLAITPEEIAPEQITCARLLHIDGHDTPAVARAASLARANRIPVTVDVDTIYPGFENVLPNVDYLIASSRVSRALDPHRRSLPRARKTAERLRHEGGGDDSGRARSAGASERAGSFTRPPS